MNKKRILAAVGATVAAVSAVSVMAVSAASSKDKKIDTDRNTQVVVKNTDTGSTIKNDMISDNQYNVDYRKIDNLTPGNYEVKVIDSNGKESVQQFGFDAAKGATENLFVKWSRDTKSLELIQLNGSDGEESYDTTLFISGEKSGVNMGMIKVDDDTYYAVVDDLDAGNYTAVVNNNGKESEKHSFGFESSDNTASSFIVTYSASKNKVVAEPISYDSADAVVTVKNTKTGKTITRELNLTNDDSYAGIVDTSDGTYEISVITKDGKVASFTTYSESENSTFVEYNPKNSEAIFLTCA